MDAITQKLTEWFQRYKFVVLIAALGIFFMLLPESKEASTQPQSSVQLPQSTPSEALEKLLAQVEGVGKVSVLLTAAEGERTIYEYDQDSSENQDSGSLRKETVLITNENRAQTGLIRQVIPPVYLGAVVVCQGGDQPGVRLAVVEAVCAATGLTADKIRVLKMK